MFQHFSKQFDYLNYYYQQVINYRLNVQNTNGFYQCFVYYKCVKLYKFTLNRKLCENEHN